MNPIIENKNYDLSCEIHSYLSPTPHFHRHIELIYSLSGKSTVTVDKKSYELNIGDFIFIFPNQIHYYNTIEKGENVIAIVSPDVLFGIKDLFFDSIPKYNKIGFNEIFGFKDMILKTVAKDEKYEITMKVGIINQIVATTLPFLNLKPRIKTKNTTLQALLDYCSINFANNITLDSISKELHISKSHISHLINDKLGMGFNTYINNLRVNRACDMLRETDYGITYISEEIGFGSIRSFNRAFKEIVNSTPLDYRKQFKNSG